MTRQEAADKVKGFTQHGFIVRSASGKYAKGPCMFCDPAGKKRDSMGVHTDKLFWKCMRCDASGDFPAFLTRMSDKYRAEFRGDVAKKLAKNRGLSVPVLRELGIGWYAKDKLLTIPFYQGSKVAQLQLKPESGNTFSTTGGTRGYIVLGNRDLSQGVWIVEGPWDAGAIREGLIGSNHTDLIIGVCGAIAGLGPDLAKLVQGLNVVLAFDNDSTGIAADKKAREIITGKVSSIRSVHWPRDLKDHYDVRNLWLDTGMKPHVFVQKLTAMVSEEPRQDNDGGKIRKTVGVVKKLEDRRMQDAIEGKGISRSEAIQRYREWMYLPDPTVLDVLFGTVFANRFRGDPLWLILCGPPGCGKTALIMSLDKAPLIFSTTTLTPQALVSGRDGPNGEDPSIIPLLDQKVLVVEDFDPILSMKQDDRALVFSVLRASYNGRFEKRFGNGTYRNYPFTYGIIVGATPKIESLGADHAIVGERFVKYYMKNSTTLNAGSDVVRSIIENMNDKEVEKVTRDALAIIGRDVLNRPVTDEHRPKLGESVIPKLHALAMWTANMRGAVSINKYSGLMIHKPVTELGTRLAKQLCKLAMGIAVFRRKKVVTLDEFKVVAKVAVSSIPDLVEEIAKQLYVRMNRDYASAKDLSHWSKFPLATVEDTLNKMVLTKILEKQKGKGEGKYRLSPIIANMMQPMGLYGKEKQWGRVDENDQKGKKVKRRVSR